jgi:hypothetical protein
VKTPKRCHGCIGGGRSDDDVRDADSNSRLSIGNDVAAMEASVTNVDVSVHGSDEVDAALEPGAHRAVNYTKQGIFCSYGQINRAN